MNYLGYRMTKLEFLIESIGWLSTLTFLISIVVPQRKHLHSYGMFTSIATGIYAYHHGATAIWVKWVIAFFFHAYMWNKVHEKNKSNIGRS
jgi:uncharacterized membrane protein